MDFDVFVSRRFWPGAKRYRCKGVEWGSPEKNGLPIGTLAMILTNEERVYVGVKHRTVRYGREFYERLVQDLEAQAGQKLPLK